jgi:hypothetical protein
MKACHVFHAAPMLYFSLSFLSRRRCHCFAVADFQSRARLPPRHAVTPFCRLLHAPSMRAAARRRAICFLPRFATDVFSFSLLQLHAMFSSGVSLRAHTDTPRAEPLQLSPSFQRLLHASSSRFFFFFADTPFVTLSSPAAGIAAGCRRHFRRFLRADDKPPPSRRHAAAFGISPRCRPLSPHLFFAEAADARLIAKPAATLRHYAAA